MTKRILVTGAAGSIGLQVIKQLLDTEQAYEVSAFDLQGKQTANRLAPYKNRVQIFWGDIRNKALVKQACEGKDIVIHLAAILPPLADDDPKLAQAVNVEGTRNIIEALESQLEPAFLLYSSSVSVYGDRLDNPHIRVSDELGPSSGDDYAVTKIEAEKLIQASRLNWSIFRLSAIFGVGVHKASKTAFQMPLVTLLEFTTVDDVARAFVNATQKQEQLNKRTFNLGGGADCRIRYDAFLERSFEATGVGKIDFPDYCFAEQNFHCAYYEDGDELENILHFRQETVDDYFEKLGASVLAYQKFLAKLVRPLVKRQLVALSEPLRAVKTRDKAMLERYFLPETVEIILDK